MRISFGPKSSRPERDADGADCHHPERNHYLGRDLAEFGGVDDRRQRADGIGDVIGAVGERQKRRGENQRQAEELS
jgi:hypothetical protein